jgi:hypothetical protein
MVEVLPEWTDLDHNCYRRGRLGLPALPYTKPTRRAILQCDQLESTGRFLRVPGLRDRSLLIVGTTASFSFAAIRMSAAVMSGVSLGFVVKIF